MRKGTIVQITDKKNHWFPCLIIVDEVKNWGIQGYITIPENNNRQSGNAFIRLETKEFEIVGKAEIITGV